MPVAEDVTSLAELAYEELIKYHRTGDLVPVGAVLSRVHSVLTSLESDASPATVLSFLEGEGFIVRQRREYLFR